MPLDLVAALGNVREHFRDVSDRLRPLRGQRGRAGGEQHVGLHLHDHPAVDDLDLERPRIDQRFKARQQILVCGHPPLDRFPPLAELAESLLHLLDGGLHLALVAEHLGEALLLLQPSDVALRELIVERGDLRAQVLVALLGLLGLLIEGPAKIALHLLAGGEGRSGVVKLLLERVIILLRDTSARQRGGDGERWDGESHDAVVHNPIGSTTHRRGRPRPDVARNAMLWMWRGAENGERSPRW